MSDTNIEWADKTVNPFVGCSKMSPGCDNCYALKMAWRLKHNPFTSDKYDGTVEKVNGNLKWTGQINFDMSCMEDLYKGPKGKTIFVGSMGDIGHENLSFDLFSEAMDECYSVNNHRIHYSDGKKEAHRFLFLTKRPDRFAALWKMYFKTVDANLGQAGWESWPLYDDVYSTFMIGTTAENQEQADWRITILCEIPSAKRFISIEPMLGSIDLHMCVWCQADPSQCHEHNKIDWVICGGESGAKARPLNPDWVKSIRDQCKAAGVPFFFKQWGMYRYPEINGVIVPQKMLRGKIVGSKIDGVEYKEFPP
jgi:protein gp37